MKATTDKKPLGEVLLELEIINEEQLRQALACQEQNGLRIGQALMQLGFVTKKDLFRALAQQYHYPYVDIEAIDILPGVISQVPEEIAHHYRVVPIAGNEEQNKLRLCMAPPFEMSLLQELEQRLEKQVEFVLTSTEQLQQAIVKYYGTR